MRLSSTVWRLRSLALIAAITWAPGAWADDLTILAGEFPPFVFKNAGKPDGAAYRILTEMAARAGATVKLTFLPWQRAQSQTLETPGAGIIPLVRTPEREASFKWVGPMISDSMVLVTSRSHRPAPQDLAIAAKWRIGTVAGSPNHTALLRLGIGFLEPAIDEATNARKLDAGRIDAWASSKLVAPFQYRLLGLDPAQIEFGAEVRRSDIFLGLNHSVPDALVERLQAALDSIRREGGVADVLKNF
jgi:polar amino acid transport system substrate-binding protein